MLGRMRRASSGLLLLFGVASCIASATEVLPLTIGIEANRTTAAPGDTITFVTTVQGESLIGVAMDYADGTTDQFGTGGAKTGRVTFRKAFMQRGMFVVVATVTDAAAGQQTARVAIIVN